MTDTAASGLDAIVKRIIEDAQRDADSSVEAANREAALVEERACADARRVLDDYRARAEALSASVMERNRTNAQLEGRKLTLARKRALIDEVFGLAYERLCALSGAPRGELLCALALREAQGGETLVPSEADAGLLRERIGEINAALAASGRQRLSMSEETVAMDGGFLLRAQSYVKSCSFTALLADVRAVHETRVAALLFDGTVENAHAQR
ncbi:MAG: V-type ATP synthase subunit E [Clostridia bacterium]|nr:V-type ATP synthase subunit E [Clostridia bacterium]